MDARARCSADDPQGSKNSLKRSRLGHRGSTAMVVGTIALVTAALFTGAAFYVSFVEHPARMSLPLAEALRQWKPAYERGAQMQVVLVIVSSICGILGSIVAGDWRWLLGALLIAAAIPYTLIVM